MTTKTKYTVTNKKPCEICRAQIKATKDNNLCPPCTERVELFNHLWRMTNHERLER